MTSPRSREDRLAANAAIAERFFDGYHHSVERGRLVGAFDPDDFAASWVFCSPYLGGETVQSRGPDLAAGAAANHATISLRIPDYKMDHLRVWPTEFGCAWRWCVNGTGVDGRRYEFWEQLFVWTDDDAKITRFEFFDDWHGFAATLAFAYDSTLDDVTRIEHYGDAPWAPGPTTAVSASLPMPFVRPPAKPQVARNLDLATRCFDVFGAGADATRVAALLNSDDFAAPWTLFTPWLGEISPVNGSEVAAVLDGALGRARERLPDLAWSDFLPWPADHGCAWRWRVAGHDAEGRTYEWWQQVFTETDETGRIDRVEIYDDWQGFPQAAGFVTGSSIAELGDLRHVG